MPGRPRFLLGGLDELPDVRLVGRDACFKVDGVAMGVDIMAGNHFQAFVLGNFEFL